MTNPLLDAAVGLLTLLEKENTALRLHDFAVTATLAESKRQAIASCADSLANLARLRTERTELAEQASPVSDTRSTAALRARLDVALAENKRLLEISVKVQAEVIAIVLRSLDAPSSPQYRVNGTQNLCSTMPVALAMRA